LILAFCTGFNAYAKRKPELLSPEELQEQEIYYSLDDALRNRQKVYRLNLERQELKEFPRRFKRLTRIQELSISYNEFELPDPQLFSLPESFGFLESLTDRENKIRTITGDQINLPKLKRLDLSINRIALFRPRTDRLTQLEYLDLDMNQTAAIEFDFTALENLKVKNIRQKRNLRARQTANIPVSQSVPPGNAYEDSDCGSPEAARRPSAP